MDEHDSLLGDDGKAAEFFRSRRNVIGCGVAFALVLCVCSVLPAVMVYLTCGGGAQSQHSEPPLLVIRPPFAANTWAFVGATRAAWQALQDGRDALDALVSGCSYAEQHPEECDYSVGYGGSPDEAGETTLDAMIVHGPTRNIGAVGCLRNVTSAIRVAQAVLLQTRHSLLVGDLASMFALQVGVGPLEDLSTDRSLQQWQQWATVGNHTPNYWLQPHNYSAQPPSGYSPCLLPPSTSSSSSSEEKKERHTGATLVDRNHDTIGMVTLDSNGTLVAGTSTNGLTFKIPGRVGDSPIPGAGAYADNEVGACACTGNGDIMMRFLPSFHAVVLMRHGWSVQSAVVAALREILSFYPTTQGAMFCVTPRGHVGAGNINWGDEFEVSIASADHPDGYLLLAPSIQLH